MIEVCANEWAARYDRDHRSVFSRWERFHLCASSSAVWTPNTLRS